MDLSIQNRDAEGLDICSSSGENCHIPAATEYQAGLMSANDKQLIIDLTERVKELEKKLSEKPKP